MSFLVGPGDPETLAEALAFVDGFDFSDNKTDEASGGSDSGESHKRRRSDDTAVPDKHDKDKSRRKNAVYAARLRAKKKNEMQQLKEQVTQLQMQLDRLKHAKTLPWTTRTNNRDDLGDAAADAIGSAQTREDFAVDNTDQQSRRFSGSSYWLQEATAQAYQREQAEQLNAQLKTLLTKVMSRSRSMQDALQNMQSLGCEIREAVGAPSTILAGMSLRSNNATPQLEELRDCLDQMYVTAQDVFAASGAGAVEVASFVSQVKRDAVSGRKVVQLSSSTPLVSDLDTASRMIWQGMQLKHSNCCKYYVHRLHVNANAIAKSFFLTLSDDSTPCTLHGAAFVRKFEERDRILYIWTATMVPSKAQDGEIMNSASDSWKLRIREKAWMMLTRSSSNPEHESVFRTCYEVSSELGQMGLDCSE
ncbi:hypothetical protein PHMEG_00010774, partial [Phytophthora megakarya]